MQKNTFCLMVLLWGVLLLFPLSSISAHSGQTFTVGTDNLNVRASPDHNAAIIAKLKAGQSVVGFKEKFGWIQTYYDGKEAWVASQYLIKKEDTAKSSAIVNDKKITINANSVRLRTGPSINHSIIKHSFKGDVYKLLETNGEWNKIELDDGAIAWVSSSLTTDETVQKELIHMSKRQNTNEVAGSLRGYNIILDAGHGGSDPGSISLNGHKEKDLTLATTRVVAEVLREAGATVLLTRSDDRYLSPHQRVYFSESYGTDAFISIHYNAHTSGLPNGISTHYYSNEQSQHLAQNIHTELSHFTNMNNRDIREDPFYVIRKNRDLSVLLELGFITNHDDLANITSSNYDLNVAHAIKKGLLNYFNKYEAVSE